jgi:hypothetical protein
MLQVEMKNDRLTNAVLEKDIRDAHVIVLKSPSMPAGMN